LLKTILNLLVLPNIRGNPRATSIFAPLNTQQGLMAMMTYIHVGQLGSGYVTTAVALGNHAKEWHNIIDTATMLTEVLSVLMLTFLDCQTNPFISSIIEGLDNRFRLLTGYSCDDDDDINEDHISSQGFSVNNSNGVSYLKERLSSIKRIQQAATTAASEAVMKKAALEKELEASSHRARQRSRAGIKFIEDASHDTDYIEMTVFPSPEELLSSAPSALPRNLICGKMSLGRTTAVDTIEVEEEFNEDEKQLTVSTNKVNNQTTSFRSINHYLNTHFQLNREDCLAQLRRGIAAYRSQLVENIPENGIIPAPSDTAVKTAAGIVARSRGNDQVYIYTDVVVESIEQINGQIGYAVTFKIPNTNRAIDWSFTSRFMNGSLLCLSHDSTFNESSLFVANVLRGVSEPNSNKQYWVPTITIGIDDSQAVNRFDPTKIYTMMESKVFFEAYRPVLHALKVLGQSDLPFSNNLLGKSTKVPPPSYLLTQHHKSQALQNSTSTPLNEKYGWDIASVFPDYKNVNGSRYWNIMAGAPLPSIPCDPPLDDSQQAAIKLALSKRLVLIQGPPGTGKTYTGLQITKLLLENRHLRAKKPILFVCQTNHALDQMLELVYKFEPKIIRVGGRSGSPIMQSLNLTNMRTSNQRLPRRQSHEYEALDEMRESIVALKAAFYHRRSFSNQKTEDLSDNIFPNSCLARLQYLLKCIASVFRLSPDIISKIYAGYPVAFHRAQWESCTKEAKLRLKHWEPDWVDSFDEWLNLSEDSRLLLMATFTDENSTSIVSIMDFWRKSAIKRKKKIRQREATADWQEVGNDPNLNLPDTADLSLDNYEEEDDESIFLNRLEDDYFENIDIDILTTTREKEAVRRIVNRSPDLNAYINTLAESHKTSRSQICKALLPERDCWEMPLHNRLELSQLWESLLRIDADNEVEYYTRQYKNAAKIESNYKAALDSHILSSANVIGMTTNGAAKYNSVLRALQPEIIVVEVY
jgi:hypothetical protein